VRRNAVHLVTVGDYERRDVEEENAEEESQISNCLLFSWLGVSAFIIFQISQVNRIGVRGRAREDLFRRPARHPTIAPEYGGEGKDTGALFMLRGRGAAA
jgi:hypothetical protein